MSSLYSLSLDSAHLERLEQLSDEEYWEYVQNLIQETNSRQPAVAVGPANPMPPVVEAVEYLECLLNQGFVLIPLSSIAEVMPPPPRYTPLPDSPPWMYGLAAWLGESIAVIDLEAYLATDSHQFAETSACQNRHAAGNKADAGFVPTIFVTRIGDVALGLWVRGIGETVMLRGAVTTSEINDGAMLSSHDKELLSNQGLHNIPVWLAASRANFLTEVSDGMFILNMPLLLAAIVHEIETVTSYE